MRPTSTHPSRSSRMNSPLERAESAFLSLARRASAPTLPLALSTDADTDTASPLDVTHIRTRMVHPSCTEQARQQVWEEVLRRRALYGEPWGTVAVGLTLPGLRRALARLPRLAEVEAAELEQEVLAAVCAELAQLTINELHSGLRLVRAGDRAAHRLLYAAQRARRTETLIWDENTVGRPLPTGGMAEVFAVLERAARAGILTQAETELIALTRLERQAMTKAAAAAGMSVRTAFRRRAAAEQRLATVLADRAL